MSAFPVCFNPTVFVSGLVWWGFVYLVTTTGFVADRLMRDKQKQQSVQFCFVLLFCYCFLGFLSAMQVSPVWVLLLFYYE